MNRQQIEAGLQAVGNLLTSSTTIAIGGSAALVLRGDISREAHDCDLALILPDSAEESLVAIGNQVARSLDLNNNWLNAEFKAWHDDFPSNWEDRLTTHDTFENLIVRLMSRADCVSTKILRMVMIVSDQDIPDLPDIQEINLTSIEKTIVGQFLDFYEEEHGCDMSRFRIAFKIPLKAKKRPPDEPMA